LCVSGCACLCASFVGWGRGPYPCSIWLWSLFHICCSCCARTPLLPLLLLLLVMLLLQTVAEGWEAFPGAKVTNEHYAITMQSEQQRQQQQQQPLSFNSCYGPSASHNQQQYGNRRGSAYPSVPTPAVPPTAATFGSSSSSGGMNPGVLAGAAVLQESSRQGSGLGLGALVGSSSSCSSRVGGQQYHASYHQHPGLPLSAPSGTQSDILHWDPPQWLPDRCG
jgi:hypothetical protein